MSAADAFGADLMVCGSRTRGAIASWLLGSTSQALLERTRLALLLVADNDVEIVTPDADRTVLHFGCVIAAVDRREHNAAQLTLASGLAHLAQQPQLLLTVIDKDDPSSPEDATGALRDRANGLEPVRPKSLVVRRSGVTEEISRCCVAEDARSVVMGLRARGRGQRPGAIATSVLSLKRASVVAVPDTAA